VTPRKIFISAALAATVSISAVFAAAGGAPVHADGFDPGARAYAAGDFDAAAREWRRLAEAGDAAAQFNLALLLDNPAAGRFDSSQAAAWYERAANQGVAAAQFNLAAAYGSGRGVPLDRTEALFWLLVAAGSEDGAVGARAAEAAQALGPALDEAAHDRAAARAQAWRAKPEERPVPSAGDKPYMTLSQADVKTIQQRLKSLGYDPGPVDGVAGPATQRAIAAYFADRGTDWHHAPLSHRLLDLLR
jgi:TPR repeat protein